MLATHLDAEKRYEKLRQEALNAANMVISGDVSPAIHLTKITSEALRASRAWSASTLRKVSWDWVDGYGAFRYRYPKRFEMAVWEKSKLTGLSMGRPTYYGSALRLDVVEASPVDLGERSAIIEVTLLAYGIYARMLGAKQVRIMHPINEEVKQYYQSFGYEYVQNDDYLFKELIG